MKLSFNIKDFVQCPKCKNELTESISSLQCKGCKESYNFDQKKIFFTSPPVNVLENTKGTEYAKWSKWRQHNYDFFKEKLGNISSDKKIVDLGTGPTQFRDLFKRFGVFVGVDFFPYELVNIVTDFSLVLPLKDQSFDVVILSNTLEHVPDMDFLLSESFRILKNGGCVIITIPFLMKIRQPPFDFNRPTYFKLSKTMQESGFKDVEIVPLSKPIDVYHKMQTHFFYELLHTQLSKNIFLNLVLLNIAKILWVFQRMIIFLVGDWLYKKPEPTIRYTEGYGVFAKK